MALIASQDARFKRVHVKGSSAREIFNQTVLKDHGLTIPTTYHCLPDFRPASELARLEAIEGWPPAGAQLPQFNALLGPFSLPKAALSPWAQSLDFMRDIKNVTLGSTQLSRSWIQTWLNAQATNAQTREPWFSAEHASITKTDRLVWRSRRVLNCLAHVLPLLEGFDLDMRAAFWSQLFDDISKICTPSDTLWETLKSGLHPLSTRANWLRAVAILGVEAAFPNYLRPEVISKASEQIGASIQGDGLVHGGSIVATLSAGADLCMLARIVSVDITLTTIRRALASLRRTDGTLVTFGSGSGDHARLLSAVLGPGDWKSVNLLLASGVGHVSQHKATIWLRTPQRDRSWGGACEIEANGVPLLTSHESAPSAIHFTSDAIVVQARCKRRDDPDGVALEASATLKILGKLHTCVRQVRISQNGAMITGEDVIRPIKGHAGVSIKEILFGVSTTSRCFLSKDKMSVLIVTKQQQAWRFRMLALDFSIEIRSDYKSYNAKVAADQMIVCKSLGVNDGSYFKASWQFVLEEIE